MPDLSVPSRASIRSINQLQDEMQLDGDGSDGNDDGDDNTLSFHY